MNVFETALHVYLLYTCTCTLYVLCFISQMELAYSDAQIYTSNKRIVDLECRLNADMKNTKFCAHCLDTIVAILNAMHPAFKII